MVRAGRPCRGADRRWLIAAVSLLCVAGLLAALPAAVPTAASQTVAAEPPPAKVGVPAYFWDTALWTRVLESGPATSDVVVSIDSGPGTARDEMWRDRRERIGLSGQKAIGFVPYAIAGTPQAAAAITGATASWFSWYDVDGIYLDGTPADCATIATVASVIATIRSQKPGARIVINSYTTPPTCIADLADAVVAFTGSATDFASWTPPTWIANRSASSIWMQIHSVPAAQIVAVSTLARTRNAGIVTVTTAGNGTYPWTTLPSATEWPQVVSAASGTSYTPISLAPPIVSAQTIASVNYFADTAAWARSRSLGAQARHVIVNPASGPGTDAVASVMTEVNAARAAGQQPLGYVHTLWGNRPVAEIIADATKYKTWYGITGVFLDEGAADCAHASHYQSITDQLRGAGFTAIVSNPGVSVPECYAFLDAIVTFEGSRSSYSTWEPLAWTRRYPASKFWHLVFDVSQSQLGQTVGAAKTKWTGTVFMTDDSIADGNPWDEYPSTPYLDTLLSSTSGLTRTPAPSAGGSGQAPVRGPAPAAAGSPTTTTVAPTPSPPDTTVAPAPPPPPAFIPVGETSGSTPSPVSSGSTATTAAPTASTPPTSTPPAALPAVAVPERLPAPSAPRVLGVQIAAAPVPGKMRTNKVLAVVRKAAATAPRVR
jgi:hypothetical protein